MKTEPELVEVCQVCHTDMNKVKPQGLVMTGKSVVREVPFKCKCGQRYVWRPLANTVTTPSGKRLPKDEVIIKQLKQKQR